MSLAINNNLMAANTARTLNSHYGRLSSSVQRLSSGLRVNSGADDAAGLAIRELMRADIAAMNQGVRNANDAISMLQVADGALAIIDEKLIRMKELAEQAATGTYDSTQRLMIDSEYQAMGAEIDRIAFATNFNGLYLLDGSRNFGHDGSGLDSSGSIKIHFGSGNDSAEDYYYIKIGDASLRGLGLAAAAPDWWNAAKIDYDNRKMILDLDSVIAGASSPNGIAGLAGLDYYNLPVGLKNITVTSSNGGSFAHKPHVSLFTKDGEQITGVPVDGEWMPQDIIKVLNTNGKGLAVPDDLIDHTKKPPELLPEYCDYTQTPPRLDAKILQDWRPDIDLNGPPSEGVHYAQGAGTWWNSNSGQQVVNAGINAGIFNPGAVYSGSNATVINKADESVNAAGATITMVTDQNETADFDEVIQISEITSDLVFIIGGHETGACNNYKLQIEADFDDDFIDRLTVHNSTGAIRIDTQDKAQQALVSIENAIVNKDKIRAHLGALQNRLENTVSNLTIQSENLQGAESRISDVDVATEMTNFVRNQILTQSAVAMLSQANSLPQMAMQLIGG